MSGKLFNSSDCPVCGSKTEDCPHTPINCRHDWLYSKAGEIMKYTNQMPNSDTRECQRDGCGTVQHKRVLWD